MARKKSLWKRFKFWAGVWLGGVLIRTLFFLAKNEVIGEENYLKPLEEGRSVILALWHGQMLGAIYALRDRDIYAMAGYHRDAEMIARVMQRLGYQLVRGSSRDRGSDAMEDSLRVMQEPGNVLAITCDGPIGPYRQVKPGAGVIAQKTNSVVVPIAVNGSRKKVIETSWDKFYLHLPLSRNRIVFGEPIYPENFTGSNPIKDMLTTIESRLNSLQDEVDRQFDKA